MKTSDIGLELIKCFEGFSPVPYLCPAGVWTIGYGSTIGVTKITPAIDKTTAELLLQSQLIRYEKSVNKLITVPLTQNQFDALVSFTYNLGGAALQRSSLRRKLNRREYEQVPTEFLKWVRAGGIKLVGLVKRRKAEGELFAK